MTDRVHEIGFLGTPNQPKNGFLKGKLNMAFLHFFDKFLAYLMILHVSVRTLKNHLICHKFAKNEENHCSTCHKSISPWPWHFRNPGFGHPIRHYVFVWSFLSLFEFKDVALTNLVRSFSIYQKVFLKRIHKFCTKCMIIVYITNILYFHIHIDFVANKAHIITYMWYCIYFLFAKPIKRLHQKIKY